MAEAFQKILIIGAKGQVGSSLADLLPPENRICLSRQELDLTQLSEIRTMLDRLSPDCVINASAHTQVDQAEKEEILARKLNIKAPAEMASWCKERSVPFIHYSTDYVFDGSGTRPWKETDPVSPVNVYGSTKAEGEQRITEIRGDHLILRTSWVYHEQGRNFVRTMIKLLQERDELKVVSDQRGAPTYARHLAQATLQALHSAAAKTRFPSGIYHLTHQGETSWFEFAQKIAAALKERGLPVRAQITPVSSSEYTTPARRPLNSRLASGKIKDSLGVELPDWEVGFKECMERIFHENH